MVGERALELAAPGGSLLVIFLRPPGPRGERSPGFQVALLRCFPGVQSVQRAAAPLFAGSAQHPRAPAWLNRVAGGSLPAGPQSADHQG